MDEIIIRIFIIGILILVISFIIILRIFLNSFGNIIVRPKKEKVIIHDINPREKTIYLKCESVNGRYITPPKELIEYIDDVDKRTDSITILLPYDTKSISPIFFEKLFQNPMKRLGKDKFKDKFIIKSTNGYKYSNIT